MNYLLIIFINTSLLKLGLWSRIEMGFQNITVQ